MFFNSQILIRNQIYICTFPVSASLIQTSSVYDDHLGFTALHAGTRYGCGVVVVTGGVGGESAFKYYSTAQRASCALDLIMCMR